MELSGSDLDMVLPAIDFNHRRKKVVCVRVAGSGDTCPQCGGGIGSPQLTSVRNLTQMTQRVTQPLGQTKTFLTNELR